MALFEWSAKYETGIGTIDAQHKKLVDYINRLHEGMSQGQASAALGVILDGLIAYTATHFKHEEKIFAKIGYEQTEDHVAHHKDLVDQVISLQKKFKEGNEIITDELMDFLKDWLTTHILKEDMKYVEAFRENKVV